MLHASVLKMNTTDNNDSVITSILNMQYSSLYYRHIHRIEFLSKRVCVCMCVSLNACIDICIILICHTTRVRTLTISNNIIRASLISRPWKVGNVSQRSCNGITYVPIISWFSFKFCKFVITICWNVFNINLLIVIQVDILCGRFCLLGAYWQIFFINFITL